MKITHQSLWPQQQKGFFTFLGNVVLIKKKLCKPSHIRHIRLLSKMFRNFTMFRISNEVWNVNKKCLYYIRKYYIEYKFSVHLNMHIYTITKKSMRLFICNSFFFCLGWCYFCCLFFVLLLCKTYTHTHTYLGKMTIDNTVANFLSTTTLTQSHLCHMF